MPATERSTNASSGEGALREWRQRIPIDVRWGISGALFITALYCAWVIGIYALNGSEPFERQGVTVTTVLTTYISIGLVAGIAVGLLRPSWIGSWARSW